MPVLQRRKAVYAANPTSAVAGLSWAAAVLQENWRNYATAQNGPSVLPALVVQVKNKLLMAK